MLPIERYRALNQLRAGISVESVALDLNLPVDKVKSLADTLGQQLQQQSSQQPLQSEEAIEVESHTVEVFAPGEAPKPRLANTTGKPAYPTYDKDARIGLLDKALHTAESILADDVVTAKDLGLWAGGVKMLIDMRRMEDGEATQRFEIDDLRNNLSQRIQDINNRGPYALPKLVQSEHETEAVG